MMPLATTAKLKGGGHGEYRDAPKYPSLFLQEKRTYQRTIIIVSSLPSFCADRRVSIDRKNPKGRIGLRRFHYLFVMIAHIIEVPPKKDDRPRSAPVKEGLRPRE